MARYLGTEGLGQWSLLFFLIGFFGLIASFGIDKLVIRDVARDRTRSKEYLTNTLINRVILLIPATVLFLVSIHIGRYSEETIKILYIAMPILFIGALTGPFNSIIQAHERITSISLIELCIGFSGSVFGVILLFLGYKIISLVILNNCLFIIRFIVYVIYVQRLIGGIWKSLNLQLQKYLIKEAFPFAVTVVLIMIYWKADYFMISKMLGEDALGLYAAPYKIFETFIMLGQAFNSALYPTISSLYGDSRLAVRPVYEKIQKYFTIVSLPVAIIIIFFAREIIVLAYGDQYLESVNVLIILFSSLGIFAISAPMRLIITNSEYMLKLVPYVFLLASLNITLNYFAIPRYGIIGAALVTLIVGIVDLFVRIRFIHLIFPEGDHPLREAWKPWICAVVMVFIIFFFEANKLALTFIGFAAYVSLLGVSGVLSKEEYKNFYITPKEILLSIISRGGHAG
jgi:O-antigen/teichoic acid export membrane protein